MDTLAIQRSLTILEERYRELREIGDKHRQAWQVELADVRAEKERLEKELGELRREKEGLECELSYSREESELLLLQLHQVQEELERYFLENQRKDEKLAWLRGQRELLMGIIGRQARLQQSLIATASRLALPPVHEQDRLGGDSSPGSECGDG